MKIVYDLGPTSRLMNCQHCGAGAHKVIHGLITVLGICDKCMTQLVVEACHMSRTARWEVRKVLVDMGEIDDVMHINTDKTRTWERVLLMATVNEELALELLRNAGHFEDDPVPARVYQYTLVTEHGVDSVFRYAVFYEKKHDDMHQSPFVKDPVLLFEDASMTQAGHAWLEQRISHGSR